MKCWYCLYTKPNAEHLVNSSLQKRGLETYLPMVVSHLTKKKRPLFPCYLFLNVDLQSVSLADLHWIPGLRHLVGMNGRPIPLPGELIILIRETVCTFEASGGLPIHSFKQGDIVRVATGSLQGLEVIFDELGSTKKQVHVLLNLLGRLNRIEVDVRTLEKISTEVVFLREHKRPRRTRGRGRHIKAT